MPAPEHYRVSIGGVFGPTSAPAEEWSMNLNYSPGSLVSANTSTLVTLANTLRTSWASGIGSIIGPHATLTKIRVARVGSDGHVLRDASGAYVQGDSTGAAVSGAGTLVSPPQVACVVTLHSTVPGITGRGRIYLPAPQYGTLGTDGRMGTTAQGQIAANIAGILNAWNTNMSAYSTGSRLVVASGGSVKRALAPSLNYVTRISVGRVLDTQRRRRRNLSEERAYTDLT